MGTPQNGKLQNLPNINCFDGLGVILLKKGKATVSLERAFPRHLYTSLACTLLKLLAILQLALRPAVMLKSLPCLFDSAWA